MKRPTLKAFLAMPCGEVTDDIPTSRNLEELIHEWAISMQPEHGQLPGVSGRAFAEWLDDQWNGWTEEEDVPVQKILDGAVTEWCGGRTF